MVRVTTTPCFIIHNLISELEKEDSDLMKLTNPADIKVLGSYRGPHLKFPITSAQIETLIAAFKKKQVSGNGLQCKCITTVHSWLFGHFQLRFLWVEGGPCFCHRLRVAQIS